MIRIVQITRETLLNIIDFSSAEQLLDIAGNIITSFKQQNADERQQHPPVIVNCISGGAERSGLITLAISAMSATQMRKPTLLSEFLK